MLSKIEFLLTQKAKRKSWLICLIILFAIGMIISVRLNIFETHYDSSFYWETADSVFANNTLAAYPKTIRGCLLPLVFSLIKHVFKVLNSSINPL